MFGEDLRALVSQGVSVRDVSDAVYAASLYGESTVAGWSIRADGTLLHPNWCGIHPKDYASHLHCAQTLHYTIATGEQGSSKYQYLKKVLRYLFTQSGNDCVLCTCSREQYPLRKRQIEGYGYKVYHTNYEYGSSTCVFLAQICEQVVVRTSGFRLLISPLDMYRVRYMLDHTPDIQHTLRLMKSQQIPYILD